LNKLTTEKKYLLTFSLWGPVLLQMALIFFFSAQPKGSPVLESFPTPPGLGHFIGYAVLGLLLYRGFNGGLKLSSGWNKKAAFKTLLVGIAYAISDEVHQLFVPGRLSSLVDLVIDTLAIVFVLMVMKMILNKMSKS
jgi:VanZ family protein